MRFVWFSYYKTVNRTAQCGAVHYYLRCSAVMLFCRRFWCGLYSLVNTPIYTHCHGFFFGVKMCKMKDFFCILQDFVFTDVDALT